MALDKVIRAYFVSDLHISSIEEPRTHWLLDFFRAIKSKNDATHLFLLGDIFDLWVAGHAYFVERFQPIVDELRRLHKLGVQIHYFEGNHDLYLDHFFGRVCGMHIHREAEHFSLGPLRVRCEHGDQMDPNDRGYRFLRWLLRTPLFEWLAPRLPERFVVWLGDRMSATSRRYTSQVKTISEEKTRAVIRAHAEKVWAEHAYDLLVSGHVHVVDDYSFTPPLGEAAMRGHTDTLKPAEHPRAVNLGSWFEEARALTVDVVPGAEPRVAWVKLGSIES